MHEQELTPTQIETARTVIAQGYAYEAIAALCGVSVDTLRRMLSATPGEGTAA